MTDTPGQNQTTPAPGVLQARCMLMIADAGASAVRLAEGMEEPQRGAFALIMWWVRS